MTKERSVWRKAWLNAKIDLQSDRKYLLASLLSIAFTVLLIAAVVAMCLLNIYSVEMIVGATGSLLMGLYYANKKLGMIDDVAAENIQNGLTSR